MIGPVEIQAQQKQIHLDGAASEHESISISSANGSPRSTIDNPDSSNRAAVADRDRIERGENISHELAQAVGASRRGY